MEPDGNKDNLFNRAGQIAADKMSQATENALDKFSGAEKNATKPRDGSGTSGQDDSTKATKDREKEPGSSFKNSFGKDRDADDKKGGFFKGKGKDKTKFSGKLNSPRNLKAAWKKGGPIGILIALLLLGGGGLMLGSQSLLFAALPAQLQNLLDTSSQSGDARSRVFFRYQTMNDRKTPKKATMFGSEKFKVTQKQAEKLKQQGITFEEVDIEGKKVKVLSFDDGLGGEPIRVAANQKDADILNKKYPFVQLYDSLIKDSTDFKNGVYAAYNSKQLWYDKKTANFLKKFKITRNLFSDFISNTDEKAKGNTRSQALNEISEHAKGEIGVELSNNKDAQQDDPEAKEGQGEDGKTSWWKKAKDKLDLSNVKVIGKNSAGRQRARLEIEAFANAYKSKIRLSGVAGFISNTGCGIAAFAGAIKTMVIAYQINQFLQLAAGYLNAFDQVKAGEGNDAAHDLLTTLTEPSDTTYYDDNYNVDSSIDLKIARQNKTAMESQGMAAIFGNNMRIDQNDVSVKNINARTSFDKGFLGQAIGAGAFLGANIAGVTACTTAKIVASGIDLGVDIAATSACIGSLGVAATGVGIIPGGVGAAISCGLELASKAIGSIGLNVGIGIGVAMLTPMISDWAFKALAKTYIDDLAGEDLGNAITAGAHDYLGKNHRYGGGSLGTKTEYQKFAQAQQAVLADRAEYERATLSPFDTSSQYTFLGSLVRQALSFATQSNAGFLTTFGNVLKKSTQVFVPFASAEGDGDGTFGDCSDLDAIGAAGDGYCNPYMMTDFSTMEADPVDIVEKVDGLHGLADKEGEVPEIADKSGLAKYVVFCENRTSPFGVVDQGFVSQLSTDEWSKDTDQIDTSKSAGVSERAASTLKSGVYSIPFIGEGMSLLEDSRTLVNMPWISGQACVANERPDSLWQREVKYYQRFEEDQRLAQSMGLLDKTSSDLFMEEYEQRHPVDDSLEGIIAQQTGMATEQVTETLAYLNEMDFLANYNPSDLGPVLDDQQVEVYDFSSDSVIANINHNNPIQNSTNLAQHYVVYADLRTRTLTA